jgi:hypothetical protein
MQSLADLGFHFFLGWPAKLVGRFSTVAASDKQDFIG